MALKNRLKERLIKLEATSLMWGSGNPEDIGYTQMDLMRDDTYIKIGLAMIKMPILTGDYIVETKSDELREFTEKYFKDRWLFTVLRNSLLSLDYGFSVQEKVYTNEDGYLVPRNFVMAEPSNITILVDKDYGDYQGVVVRGAKIPGDKTWLYTYNLEFNNYYGKSILRSPYRAWYDEQLVNLAMLRHSEAHASPISVLYYPKDIDENDNLQNKSTAESIVKNISYRKSVAIPFDADEKGNTQWKFEMVSAGQAKPEGYEPIIQYCNKKKLLGLLVLPQVIDRDGGTGTYAESSVKLDTTLMLIEGIQRELIDGLNKHVIEQFIELNFNTKDEVLIKALPLEKTKQNLLTEFTKELLKTNADADVIGLANQYMKEMYQGDVENQDAPSSPGEDETPQDEKY